MAHRYGVELEKWHSAEADATATGKILIKILEDFEQQMIKS